MGELYLAHDPLLDRPVALKVVRRDDDQHQGELVNMLLEEARITTLLVHTNIVRVHGVDFEGGAYYMVMDWLQGWDLARVMTSKSGPLHPLDTVSIIVGAARGLHAAHESKTIHGKPTNLVHRDVSPQNLFVTEEGVTKVLDFGIAKSEVQQERTRAGTVKGKVAYMSPEQLRGDEVDRRSDIFSLGVVLHELLRGQRLFQRSDLPETYRAVMDGFVPPPTAKDVPEDIVLVSMRALKRNRDRRFQSAAEFADALLDAVGGIKNLPAKSETAKRIQARGLGEPQVARGTPEALSLWAETVANTLDGIGAPISHEEITQLDDNPLRNIHQKPSSPVKQPNQTALKSSDKLALLGGLLLSCLFAWIVARYGQNAPLRRTPPPIPTRFQKPQRPPAQTTRTEKPAPTTEFKSALQPVPSDPGKDTKKPSRVPPKRRKAKTRNRVATSRVVRSKPGKLTLDSHPWADVYLGGKKLGTTPLVDYSLPPGTHKLLLSNQRLGIDKNVSVVVSSGKHTRRRIQLTVQSTN